MKRDPQNSCFNFTQELMKTTRFQNFTDLVSDNTQMADIRTQKYDLSGNVFQQQSHLVTSFQSTQYIIYCFIKRYEYSASFITLNIFQKQNGRRSEKTFQQIRGKVTSALIVQFEKAKKKKHKAIFSFSLVLGCQSGEIKIVDLGESAKLETFRIQNKPIVDLKMDKTNIYKEKKVCFALVDDYSIFVISLDKRKAIGHFRPTIMMCDSSLNISLHQSGKYVLQSTKGGYIVLWKVNKSLLKNEEERKVKIEEDEKLQNQNIKSVKKVYNVFPLYILHSASIDGLLWSSFYGDLVAIITKKGYFKLIAINIEEKQEHAVIIEHKIKNQKEIKDAIVFQEEECIAILKQDHIQFLFFSPELTVSNIVEFQLTKRVEQKQYHKFDVKFKGCQKIILNQDRTVLMVKSYESFYIVCTSSINKKLKENVERNSQFREVHEY